MFKKRDRVIAIEKCGYDHDIPIGSIGQILAVNEKLKTIHVTFIINGCTLHRFSGHTHSPKIIHYSPLKHYIIQARKGIMDKFEEQIINHIKEKLGSEIQDVKKENGSCYIKTGDKTFLVEVEECYRPENE